MKDAYASRKFILAMCGLAVSTALLWYGKLDGMNFVALNSVLGGAYMAANAAIARINNKH